MSDDTYSVQRSVTIDAPPAKSTANLGRASNTYGSVGSVADRVLGD